LGSEADPTVPKSNVRFTPESGLKSEISPCPLSANNGPQIIIIFEGYALESLLVTNARSISADAARHRSAAIVVFRSFFKWTLSRALDVHDPTIRAQLIDGLADAVQDSWPIGGR
jgi:hypothetical protein